MTDYLYYGLDDHARELIAMACGDAPWVDLAPLDKGLSGSSVLMARWEIGGAKSKFHVFKIGDPRKLSREHKAITQVAAAIVQNFPHASLYRSADGSRALLSQEFLGENDGSSRSLRQYIDQVNEPSAVADILGRLYGERLISWRPSASRTRPRMRTVVREQLAAWIRKGDLAKAIDIIGCGGLEARLQSLYSLRLRDLERLVGSILDSDLIVDTGPVHGDLHSQNVLIDHDLRISLIDFGWTAIRWRAVDYLWLECSLKFVVGSAYAGVDDLLFIEELLDRAWAESTSVDLGALQDRLLSRNLQKIALGVARIREEARSELPELSLADYRKGLVAMGYSLTTFPELNLVYLLHSIARQASLLAPLLNDQGPYRTLYAAADGLLWPGRAGRMVRKAVETAPAPGVALDIGCGDGKDLVFLEDHGWRVRGFDICERAIAGARTRFAQHFGSIQAQPDVSQADARAYVYEERSYDLVVAYGLYHCLDDDAVAQVHASATAALKPGGLLAFAAFNDQLPIPDGHLTGELYLRPADHIFELARNEFEVIAREVGTISESHGAAVEVHQHSLTWALLRKL